ncbi:MAG: HAMP domain-containing histidine kinase [Crocinitomicaceae bacterium]|nr:HAMP domain-containing histidine kinase [Crocinitomicaceae bacterium]
MKCTFGPKKGYSGASKLHNSENGNFIVLVIAEDINGAAHLSSLANTLLIVLLIAIFISFLLSYFLAANILKPIASKIIKANTISAKKLDTRLTVYNEKDEIGLLAKSFNTLLDRLQRAFNHQSSFIRFASHELKNPLAVIIGETEVALLSVREKDEYIAVLNKVHEKAEHINTMLELFFNLSQLEKTKLNPETLRIEELTLDTIQTISQNSKEEAKIKFNIHQDLPSNQLEIKGDRELLEMAIQNIIENAIKFTKDSSEEVEVGLFNADGFTVLEIRDKGIGVPDSFLEKIYDPMFRAENASEIQGTGIGLSLVKRVVDLHGFQIKVDSKLNVGTAFQLRFSKI